MGKQVAVSGKQVLTAIVALYVFLLGIELMGASFKLFGAGFAEQVMAATTNPIVALFIGLLATTLVQSSSVSTSMIVGMTAGGALTITHAIPMIMGANIGTSITNTLASLGHITREDEFQQAFEVATVHDFFNILIVILFLPIELMFHPLERGATFLSQFLVGKSGGTFQSPLDIVIEPVADMGVAGLQENAVVMLVVSFIMIYAALRQFVQVMRPYAETGFRDHVQKHVFGSPIRSFLCGIGVTAFVQSSSISTSIIIPFAGLKVIDVKKVFPYILGANVGTTFTALMAALVAGSQAALIVALIHLLFNVAGSAVVYPFRRVPMYLSITLARHVPRSRTYPLMYIISLYYALPGSVVLLFH